MSIVTSLICLAEEVVSPATEFPEVTLYHGSFLANLGSIQANGIVPRAVNAKAAVMNAVDEISIALDLSSEQDKELRSGATVKYAIDRIQQSGFSKVYLSGERDFAVSNAKAGGEWYEGIVNTALQLKHEEFFELQRSYAVRIMNLERLMEQQDKAFSQAIGTGDEEEYRRLFRELRETNKQHDELQRERDKALSGRRSEIGQQEQAVLRKRFGDKAVVFRVVMPYRVFVSKIASPSSRERIEMFEKMYADYVRGEGGRNWFVYIHGNSGKVWEFFQEVHLTGVEPHFIKGWEVVN